MDTESETYASYFQTSIVGLKMGYTERQRIQTLVIFVHPSWTGRIMVWRNESICLPVLFMG